MQDTFPSSGVEEADAGRACAVTTAPREKKNSDEVRRLAA